MDLKTRIRRHQDDGINPPIVRNYQVISPSAHAEEPTNRGPTLERLLDYLDPVFEGQLPTDAYIWGQSGVGKSAVITALFEQMSMLLSGSGMAIHTSTRAPTAGAPTFIYIDTRQADSAFNLYHDALDAVLEESVPQQGIKTDTLRSRLVEWFQPAGNRAIIAVDHVNEPGTPDFATLDETFTPLGDSVACVTVGRTPPADLAESMHPPERIEIPRYERHALVDLLTSHASDGLSQGTIGHEQLRQLADWADGNAHDALAALFGAAILADLAGHDQIHVSDLTEGMDAVPRPTASIGRVHALPSNRQLVLRELVALGESSTESVGTAAEAIADSCDVDLSTGTVRRVLYELANDGIIQRVATSTDIDAGRPPSRLEPRFPTLVFRYLHDLDDE